MKLRALLLAIGTLLSTSLFAQHTLQLDNGTGQYSTITGNFPGGAYTLPPGGGQFLVIPPDGTVPLSGDINMQNYIITNIGNAGTDFTSEGGLNLAGPLTVGSSTITIDGSLSTNTISSSATLSVGTSANDSLLFQTNSDTRMMVSTDGKVGIGTLNPQSPLHIVGAPPDPTYQNADLFYVPDPYNHVLTVENTMTNGKGNGIAIVIKNPASSNVLTDGEYNSNSSNYITFYNDAGTHDHVKGRIEGFSYQNYLDLKDAMIHIWDGGELFNPFNYFTWNIGFDEHFISYNSDWITYNSDFIDVQLPHLEICHLNIDITDVPYPCHWEGGHLNFSSPFTVNSSPFTINGSPITHLSDPISLNQTHIDDLADEIRALPYKDKIADLAMNPMKAAVTFGTSFLGGITYESGSGDYAEWLERLDESEKITVGDVVGVFGGKITKNTSGADHCMVISWKPIVLGNMPDEGRAHLYNKVAFMGQVPVKLVGGCSKGDFIIPSDKSNGFAQALRPTEISAADLKQVIGVAWEDVSSSHPTLAKIAVGLKPNDIALVLEKQQTELDALRQEVAEITRLVKKQNLTTKTNKRKQRTASR